MNSTDMLVRLLAVLVRRNGGLKTISQAEVDAAEKGGLIMVSRGDVLELQFYADRDSAEYKKALAGRETAAATATEAADAPPRNEHGNPPPPPPDPHGLLKKGL